jgi:hypothetical protein
MIFFELTLDQNALHPHQDHGCRSKYSCIGVTIRSARAGCAMKRVQLCDPAWPMSRWLSGRAVGELCFDACAKRRVAARATLRRELKNPPSCDKRRHKNDGIGRSASGKRGGKLEVQTLTGYHAVRRNIPPGIRLESGAWYGPNAPDARHGRFWDANGCGRYDPFEMTKV